MANKFWANEKASKEEARKALMESSLISGLRDLLLTSTQMMGDFTFKLSSKSKIQT